MTSGLETDYCGRMGRDGKARKQMKRVRKGKIKDTKIYKGDCPGPGPHRSK